jgi:uncharacterized protein (DUF885 family)
MRSGRCWRRRRRAAGIAVLLCLSLVQIDLAQAQSPDWASLQADYIAFTHITDPLRAGARGDRVALTRWPDDSPAALAAQKTTLLALKGRLERQPAAQLPAEAQLSRAVMLRQMDLALESLTFDEARLPFQTGQGFFTLPDTQAQVTTLANEVDAQAWLTRMSAIPAYFAVETANLRRGIATGFTQPALVVRAAMDTLEKTAHLPVEQSPLLLPFATLPAAVPAARRVALTAQARQIVLAQVQPAQAQLAAFLRSAYLPHARAALGVATLPDGERYYALTVRRETTTTLTPAQIHELGAVEVARIRAAMQDLMTAAGYQGGVRAFAAKLKADPHQYAADIADYAARAAEVAKRIDYLLPRYFGTLPRLTYGVRAKPAALESTSDGYLPGSPESGQAGTVVYNASTALQSPLYSLPAWLLHEGVPGHHLQIALAQENTTLPEFRRDDDITAFVEGWALYAERLGEDMGVYRNAEERFGRLSMEMWRACRLLIDTGVHAMGWTREHALACLKDNTAMTDESIDYEVDRYIGWPGQALGYKIGELRIEQMRAAAERRLGPAFDLRGFHDALLREGALPMDLLEQQVENWVAARRSQGAP